ncbi:hypothetical protein CEUSTIGMA_g9723.t1 [Chlamydomonas eustigma]|uniref:RRM domain-containing protein n=1 Tax=Chlamydomonas eustigma TaxID=1157962 RepID=A0A250XGU1_9CHLO|nr:hypothetical protein CEUSTIGMA_g9723.t1 [Chlamydomonas eustigma]|eukprot:GAX82294.1 hypothetical protein CEUSTIGMA_g9723.t1 [Chlamydomonas eustigma]
MTDHDGDDRGRRDDEKQERHRRSRSKSRDRRRDSRRSRSLSRDDRRRRDRSRSSERYKSRRSRSRERRRDRARSPEDYKPKRQPAQPTERVGGPRNGPGTGADPFANLRQPVASVDPAEIQRLWQEQQLRARQLVLQQQSLSARSAATKSQREIHVGNLVPGATTDLMLQQIFNTALGVRFPSTPGLEPVIKVNIHKDGRYAFIELRSPEMATAAMDLNGQVQFLGQSMSVNRPSGYVDPGQVTLAAAAATSALHAFQSTGGALGLQQAALASLAASGAGLNPGGMLGGYPGLPTTVPASQMPMSTLQPTSMYQATAANSVMPGGLYQTSVQAPYSAALQHQQQQQHSLPSAYAPPPDQVVQPSHVMLQGMSHPHPAPAGSGDGNSNVPTQCLCMLGMVGADVLMNDLEYEEVLEDLRVECDKQAPGMVAQVKVPRPPQPELSQQLMNTGNYGKALVLFHDVMSAVKARDAIHGRMFAGRPIQVSYITPDAFVRCC